LFLKILVFLKTRRGAAEARALRAQSLTAMIVGINMVVASCPDEVMQRSGG